MKSLKDVLTYENGAVIEKFQEDYYFDTEEAQAIFRDTLTWLWLAASSPDDKLCAMYHSMAVMDKMWHTFMAFSRDYEAFCGEFFGRFVHHEPHTRSSSKRRLTPTIAQPDPIAQVCAEIEAFQSHVYDQVGADTLLRWFVTYPHVYSPEELHRRARPQFSERGFLTLMAMRKMSKEEILKELDKTRLVVAYCGGPGCGPMCMEP